MAVKTYDKKINKKLSENFSSFEFNCHCSECSLTLIDDDHVHRLQIMREMVGKPITLNDGYRCPIHNKEVGGVVNSQHVVGTATDIRIDGMSIPELYELCCGIFDGVGIYDTFVHCDSRGVKARWDLRTDRSHPINLSITKDEIDNN